MTKTALGWILGIMAFCSTIVGANEIAYTQAPFQTNPLTHAESIVKWAQHRLPHSGILTEKKDGFVYLKVDNDFINKLGPMLKDPAYTAPPYFRRGDSPGAHISVFYVDERSQTGKIKEIGHRYEFEVRQLAAVPSKTQEYIVLQVYSPELERLRERYGLPPLISGHDFHITIAKKKHWHRKGH